MPIYEYLCKDCRNLFEKILTLAEYDREPIDRRQLNLSGSDNQNSRSTTATTTM
jgi:hypothetical protein